MDNVPKNIASDPDPAETLARLAASTRPFLIGVRHHSPACAAAIPALLDRAQPEKLFVELPTEFQPWIEWLGHEQTRAPVALASVGPGGGGLGFYPFADFSPELAAVRWANARGVPVVAFDLPSMQRGGRSATHDALSIPDAAPLMPALLRAVGADDSESLWDLLVEARAPGADPEDIRRAGLLTGWAMRLDAAHGRGVDAYDLRRETFMRALLDGVQSCAVVVGAFHASALLDEPLLWEARETERGDDAAVITSMIAYSHELLDSRSGYPAGIRDPFWQQRVWETMVEGSPVDALLAEFVTRIAADVRAMAHVAGVPDAREAVRVATDLARLRGLPAAGRRELLEAIETALGQGELFGRGRVLARALERALVGTRRGKLALGTPRSGLAPHVEALFADLGLPGPTAQSEDTKRFRLDPLRSDLDCRRRVALARMRVCGVPYGEAKSMDAIGATDTLTEVWDVRWTPATEALLELAGVMGVTLEQAAGGALRAAETRARAAEKWTAAAHLEALHAAAECVIVDLARERLEALAGSFLDEAGLAEVVAAVELVERMERGHIPGFDPAEAARDRAFKRVRTELLSAAMRAIEGLAGSERIEDARALLDVVHLFERERDQPGAPGDGRLGWAIDTLARDGSPLIQGAAGAVRVMAGREASAAFGHRAGSWVDTATDSAAMGILAKRIRGALVVAAPLFEADPGWAAGLIERIEQQTDAEFLRKLPALREGFDVLSPASRSRFLAVLSERFADGLDPRGFDVTLEEAPEHLALWAEADREGLAACAATLDDGREALVVVAPTSVVDVKADVGRRVDEESAIADRIPAKDRWRLILGRERDRLQGATGRAGRALDDLYGMGRGEGSRGLDGGSGGGKEEGFPSVREWAEELESLFGADVREEVLGRAIERGRSAALLAVDPESVTPSIELLEHVLSLKGGLPEAHLGQLRRIVRRVVDDLVRELAVRVRPALTGLSIPRPTRRPGGPLDLRRTIAANLKTAHIDETEGPSIVPERLIFKSRARRSMDWRVILVVDVSGSMEASIIYSAMMAAILSAVPAVSVNFVAFNTQIIDLSDRVDDPLGLLLEVSVGGGTHIAQGLQYARGLMKVPTRTLVLLVTDFEEGWPVDGLLAEVRTLAESGAKPLGLAALDDRGQPRFNRAVAELVVGAGMPVAALTPLELARWIGERIR